MVKPTRVTNRITELRAAAGMSQAELGDRIGVTRQTVNAIEGGKYSPSLEVAFKIAQVPTVPLGSGLRIPRPGPDRKLRPPTTTRPLTDTSDGGVPPPQQLAPLGARVVTNRRERPAVSGRRMRATPGTGVHL